MSEEDKDTISDEDKRLSDKEIQEKYFPNSSEMNESSSDKDK